jgi:predicted Zn-dependent protease
LGHEIGHVTAAHSANQMSRAQLAQAGLGVAVAVEPSLQQFAQVAQAGLQLLFLSFSREDETQADELGVRYMTRLDYDPNRLVDVMETLRRVSGGQKSGRVPEWLSTHPYPETRKEDIQSEIRESGFADGQVAQERYLEMIDGIVYGANPREGFVREGVFYHPDLRLRVDFPQSWQVINEKQAVTSVSPQKDAVMALSVASAASLDAAASEFFREGIQRSGNAERLHVHGVAALEEAFSVQTDSGPLAGRALFLDYEGRIYRLLAYSTAGAWPGYEGIARQAMRSFQPLTDQSLLSVRPLRLEIVTIGQPMTLREFHERFPSPTLSLDQVALLNQGQPDTALPAGAMVKRVIGEPWAR